jgi:hypothetical protein
MPGTYTRNTWSAVNSKENERERETGRERE